MVYLVIFRAAQPPFCFQGSQVTFTADQHLFIHSAWQISCLAEVFVRPATTMRRRKIFGGS